MPTVFVFYFAFIPYGIKHWKWLVTDQLKELKASGLLDVSSLTVIAATNEASLTASEDMTSLFGIIKNIAGANATLLPRYKNRYEYWGLYSMWEKAMSQDIRERNDSVFLYLHSKGMVNHGELSTAKAKRIYKPLFNHVIEPWKDVLFRFETVPDLHKAGFAISYLGFMFFNFIWARSSYVARLEAPVEFPHSGLRGGESVPKKENVTRFYYEHWIAHTVDQSSSTMNGWSMALDGFHLGVCLSVERTRLAFKSNQKALLTDQGVFNCSSPRG